MSGAVQLRRVRNGLATVIHATTRGCTFTGDSPNAIAHSLYPLTLQKASVSLVITLQVQTPFVKVSKLLLQAHPFILATHVGRSVCSHVFSACDKGILRTFGCPLLP